LNIEREIPGIEEREGFLLVLVPGFSPEKPLQSLFKDLLIFVFVSIFACHPEPRFKHLLFLFYVRFDAKFLPKNLVDSFFLDRSRKVFFNLRKLVEQFS